MNEPADSTIKQDRMVYCVYRKNDKLEQNHTSMTKNLDDIYLHTAASRLTMQRPQTLLHLQRKT